MKDRDRHPFLEPGFDVEALRGLDVFEIDAAQGRLHRSNQVDQLVRVALAEFNVKNINPGKLLEQTALAFHDRFGCQRTDVTQAEHGSTVGDDAYEVGSRGVQADRRRVINDGMASMGNSWRIGEGQIELITQALGGLNRDLARSRVAMIFEGGLARTSLTGIIFHVAS